MARLGRRTFLCLAAGGAALSALSQIAWADTYPSRPVRVIVRFEAIRSGEGARPESAPIVRPGSSEPTPAAAVVAPRTTVAADSRHLGSSVALALPAIGCDAQSMLADPVQADAACVPPDLERDQAYLVETANPGGTMLRQGPALAIARLYPVFVRRLAEAIRKARDAGLPSAGIFSAYRPPAFGVGGFIDKFNSLHSYGLAVDMVGIGGPSSSEATFWHGIAAEHGIVCPYGANNRREWNHCQPTQVKIIRASNPLRGTVSSGGPLDLEAMFTVGDALVSGARAAPALSPASDQDGSSLDQEDSSATGRNKALERTDERHPQLKFITGLLANQAHGQLDPRFIPATSARSHDPRAAPSWCRRVHHPRRDVCGLLSAKDAVKSGPVKKYRPSSLIRRNSLATDLNPASSKQNALAKRIEKENTQVDRLLKDVCRGC